MLKYLRRIRHFHRHHHRRLRLHRRRVNWRTLGRLSRQLRRLPNAQSRTVFQHRADGVGADVEATGCLSCGESVRLSALKIVYTVIHI